MNILNSELNEVQVAEVTKLQEMLLGKLKARPATFKIKPVYFVEQIEFRDTIWCDIAGKTGIFKLVNKDLIGRTGEVEYEYRPNGESDLDGSIFTIPVRDIFGDEFDTTVIGIDRFLDQKFDTRVYSIYDVFKNIPGWNEMNQFTSSAYRILMNKLFCQLLALYRITGYMYEFNLPEIAILEGVFNDITFDCDFESFKDVKVDSELIFDIIYRLKLLSKGVFDSSLKYLFGN